MVKCLVISALAVFGLVAADDLQSLVNTQSYYEYYENVTDTYTIRYDAGWDEVRHIFDRGTDAVVRDLLTGRTFAIRRTFGRYHADVEPLTTEDTATMYDIWGGWSWSRRPVAVYVNGYVFAGSLTNFPHGGVDHLPASAGNLDAVKGNGMDGHVCLHFEGSRIHGSGRINQAHMDAVAQARQILKN
ncbi:MAG: hypothetical protein FWB98_01670 [Defluviitaleaceae bacterium]|nr:hypothetical protein [Defluviitaleaceae bacterium]